jgi:hypothetical protein
MEPRKNGSEQNLAEDRDSFRQTDRSQNRINDEDNLDTRDISHSVEEGDEDYDDEQLEEGELTEDDFAGEDDDEDDVRL